MTLEPDAKRGDYLIPKKVKISFSDGSSMPAELRIGEYFQIISLPNTIRTNSIKFTVEEVWKGSGVDRTGLCKLKAFGEAHQTSFRIETSICMTSAIASRYRQRKLGDCKHKRGGTLKMPNWF
jgi:hypothetical protein